MGDLAYSDEDRFPSGATITHGLVMALKVIGEMTAFALGVHDKLTQEYGVDPRSDEYYEKINSRMRQVFPAYFDDGIDEPEEKSQLKLNLATWLHPLLKKVTGKHSV